VVEPGETAIAVEKRRAQAYPSRTVDRDEAVSLFDVTKCRRVTHALVVIVGQPRSIAPRRLNPVQRNWG